MKIQKFFTSLLILAALVQGSCNKQKEPSVSLLDDSYINTDVEVSPGDALRFKWIAEKGKSDLSSFTIRINGEDAYGYPVTPESTDVYIDSTYMEGSGSAGDYTYAFIAEDVDGNSGEASIVVSVR